MNFLKTCYKYLFTDLQKLGKKKTWPDGKVPLLAEYLSHIRFDTYAYVSEDFLKTCVKEQAKKKRRAKDEKLKSLPVED